MLGQNFAQQVYQRRKEMNLSLREIARISGIAASTISRIENGLYSPTLENAVKIAAALRMELPPAAEPPALENENIVLAPDRKEQAQDEIAKVVDYRTIAITIIKPGVRRNLSKIAARNAYDHAILLKGAIQLRTNDGFRENLKPGATINCKAIVRHTFFAVAAEEAELLWIR